MKKTILSLLLLSAAIAVTPASANYFSNPRLGMNLNIGSAPNPTPAQVRSGIAEERTTVKVDRIHSRWAGLRSFTPDRHPAVGFAEGADGFFWLAGQGGFGLQTSPAMAGIASSLIAGDPWPVSAVSAGDLSPGRFETHSPTR